MPLIDTRDWCDVDSDEDFCIPELPPLPELVPLELVTEASPLHTKTEQTTEIVTPTNPQRFRVDWHKIRHPKPKTVKSKDYVCFVGKFPNKTTIADLRSFVESKGISYTDIRLGPKKKPNVNSFGYVDLPTKKDYDMLLSQDGTYYKGRAIRVDHATRNSRKATSKSERVKRELSGGGDLAPNSTPPLKQRKSYERRELWKKPDVHTSKTKVRCQRYNSVRGTRRRQKYSKVQKSLPKKNIRYRLEPIHEKVFAKVAVVIEKDASGRK